MKVLALTRYDRQGASSRLRTMQYLPALAEAGLETRVESLFDAAYLEQMYAGRRSARTVLAFLLRRISGLAREADVIWLEKEALPWVPWMVEKLFWPRNTPIITDYDDAIFHRYDSSRHSLVRMVMGQKVDRIMGASSVVVAGNPYLAKRAHSAGAPRVEIVPTVVDVEQYESVAFRRSDDQLRIGWIGTPETWASFATGFAGWIVTAAKSESALFRVVGGEPAPRRDGVYEFLPWSEATEISLIKGMDIGLMPLPDTPWTRGKCGYKLIQYMACGLPVIASPVGVNTEIVEHGVNGFLASTEAEWTEALQTLLSDPALRARMGEEGRRKIERDYSLQVWGPRVAQILRDVGNQSRAD